jgi:hypothetical protein
MDNYSANPQMIQRKWFKEKYRRQQNEVNR